MTNASMSFGRPARVGLPAFAPLFGGVAAFVIGALRKLDAWQLRQQSTQPRTAEEVLDWASRVEASDPGFAADLRAAVLRSQADEAR